MPSIPPYSASQSRTPKLARKPSPRSFASRKRFMASRRRLAILSGVSGVGMSSIKVRNRFFSEDQAIVSVGRSVTRN
ncbi:MAG: hypothetical protein DYG85_00455 [Chloroflexi bacterium CFX1]|nr:hypothetical protein [Chloroflexi bacterium CFX1]MCQ3951670.1 hypothetical protein [Chloroflexota bacterium]